MIILAAMAAQLLVTNNFGQVIHRKTYPTMAACMRAQAAVNAQRSQTKPSGIIIHNRDAPTATCIPT